jgi:hypothetical protein
MTNLRWLSGVLFFCCLPRVLKHEKSRRTTKVSTTTPSDVDPLYEELRLLEEDIRRSEGESMVARWEFGRALAKLRVGKRLPKSVRDEITDQFDLQASEITRRMRLADWYATREGLVDMLEIDS